MNTKRPRIRLTAPRPRIRLTSQAERDLHQARNLIMDAAQALSAGRPTLVAEFLDRALCHLDAIPARTEPK